MPNILVIGSINMDMVARIDHIPLQGESVLGEGYSFNPGGKGANSAVAAARLGGKVSFAGCVGRDDAGIDSFESGSYHVGNQDVGQMSEKQLAEFRNKSIGMVMQDFALIEEYTVQENLLVPLIFGKVKKREQSKKIMDVLEKVNIAELKDKRVNQLSGGQKQRVAIARALINSPEYILADEPTGALDSNTSDDIMDVFEELNKNGHTVIIVTHDNGVAARCQRVIEIKDGEVLSE